MFPIESGILQIDLTIKPNFIWDDKIHGQSLSGDINTEQINTGETFWIIIEDCDGNYLYFSDMIIIRPSYNQLNKESIMEDEYYLNCQIFLEKKDSENHFQDNILPPLIFVRAIADRWLHSETCIPISLEKVVLPKKAQDNTELLDLKPINVLKAFSEYNLNSYLEKMFDSERINGDTKLNSIQTQLFNLIFNSDKSLFLSSPPGNGQFICTCIAILRQMRLDPDFEKQNFQILFLCCNNDKVEYLKFKFYKVFGENLVGYLNGNNFSDIQTLEQKTIIISNTENWDKIGKKLLKTREFVKKLKLLVIDSVEFIYNNFNGFIIESAISRLRYIITPLNLQIRIFAYSKCISNAFDISEWLGIAKENTFSFDQNIFNEQIEKKVIGFDSYYRSTRLQLMFKYIKEEISKLRIINGIKETLLIFVLEYEFCLNLSNELSLFILENLEKTPDSTQNLDSINLKNNFLKFSVSNGIGFLYKNQSCKEREYVISEYTNGKLNIIIACEDMNNSITLRFDKVIVMDTKKIDYEDNKGSLINNKTKKVIDYSHLEVHQMLSRCKKMNNGTSNFVLLCSTNKQEFYEYILSNSLPLESNIDIGIIDCINTEIALRTIKTKQDTIDWITWTFFYRRLSKNPSYYGLTGKTNKHISDYLSEYLEEILNSLSIGKCIQIVGNNEKIEDEDSNENIDNETNETDDNIIPLNLCLISAFYNIKVSSIEFISKNIYENDTYSSLLHLISLVPILQENCIIRKGDILLLTQLNKELNLKLDIKMNQNIISTKIQLLLNCYLRRHKFIKKPLLKNDLITILKITIHLFYAMIDVSSSFGWINTSLRIMELSQMFVQAIYNPVNEKLMQLPYVNKEQIKLLNKNEVNDIYDLINMEDYKREDLLINKLSLKQEEINEIAEFCNNFPIIETQYDIIGCDDTRSKNKKRKLDHQEINGINGDQNDDRKLFECDGNSELILLVNIIRDLSEYDSSNNSPIIVHDLKYYPFEKEEQWWIILIEMNLNEEFDFNEVNDKKLDKEDKIICIRRIQLNKSINEIKLKFNSSKDSNKITDYKLLIVCDSYIGCDLEFSFSIRT